ncbi:MAG: XkdX family protein [Synergistaceae bacterium]|nr:XkdX family protein [Synergistaceae bacterium]
MSAKFEQVKNFYNLGVWSETKLRNAVAKAWITADEFRQITGKNY